MKTSIYIDGYNLYYGVLRGTSYKWLDIFKLFQKIATEQNPQARLEKVKFFTAPVKANFSSRGQQATQSQALYHKALQTKYPDHIEIIEGYFQLSKGNFPIYQTPIDKDNEIDVWRLEEKQTDVNIAVHLYRDVTIESYEQVIIISNDSDIVPALDFIKKDFSNTIIGAVLPKIKPKGKQPEGISKEIRKRADWTRHYILENELANSQLPLKVPTRKKTIFKPDYW